MIPKRLIRVWMGRQPKSSLFASCLASHERVLRGWEILDVDENNCGEVLHSPFMQAAASRGDFVYMTAARIWAVFKYGGLYVDADMEIFKDPAPLLDANFLICRERDNYFGDAVFGSEAHGEIISRWAWSFPWHEEATRPLIEYGPPRTSDFINGLPERLKSKASLLSPEYFYPHKYGDDKDKVNITSNTYGRHMWCGSWLQPKE